MMRIAICENDKNQLVLMNAYIDAWAEKTRTRVQVEEFSTAESFLLQWTDVDRYDLLFLDIRLGNLSGVELAHIIRKLDANVPLVFVTGCKEFVLEGYEVNALHYLIKPIDEKDLEKCLDKVSSESFAKPQRSFVIDNGSQTVRFLHEELYYFESFSHYLTAHTTKGPVRFRETIKEIEERLPKEDFVRTHRSYIANMHFARLVEKSCLTLENGTELPISRSRWHAVNEAFVNRFTKQ